MRYAQWFVVICGVLSWVPPAIADEMQSFTSSDGKFEVRFPTGEIRTSTEKTADGDEFRLFGVETPNALFAASFSDLANLAYAGDDAKEQILDLARDNILNKQGGTLLGEAFVKLQGVYLGRHLRISIKPTGAEKSSLMRATFYIVGGRMYTLFVQGSPADCDGPEADEFLHSLKLLGRDPFSKDRKFYTSPDGKFQARFPLPPHVEQKDGATRYVIRTDQGDYVVTVKDEAGLGNKSYDERYSRLDDAVNAWLDARDGDIIELVDIKLANKYDGYFLRAEIQLGDDPNNRGLYRGRFVIVGDRLYEAYITGPTKHADNEWANSFLNSFVVKP